MTEARFRSAQKRPAEARAAFRVANNLIRIDAAVLGPSHGHAGRGGELQRRDP
jgi:hypothetical protein